MAVGSWQVETPTKAEDQFRIRQPADREGISVDNDYPENLPVLP